MWLKLSPGKQIYAGGKSPEQSLARKVLEKKGEYYRGNQAAKGDLIKDEEGWTRRRSIRTACVSVEERLRRTKTSFASPSTSSRGSLGWFSVRAHAQLVKDHLVNFRPLKALTNWLSTC